MNIKPCLECVKCNVCERVYRAHNKLDQMIIDRLFGIVYSGTDCFDGGEDTDEDD